MVVKFSLARCGGAGLLAIASAALAQESAVSPRPAPLPSAAANAEGQPDEPLEGITVTGTRIMRNGYEAPTPVTVATLDELRQETPSNIPDALNKLPQFASSTTLNSTSNSSTFTAGN